MKILVSGADGYIGVMLCAYLLARGYDVTGLDTGFFRAGWLFPAQFPKPLMLSKDIRTLTLEDLHGYEAVVHLAELSNDPLGEIDTQITQEINHLGSSRFAKMCKTQGIQRFVYMSSCSVYGFSDKDWVDETSPVNPLTAYARCKVQMENVLQALSDESFHPIIFRNATAYGASPRMRFDLVLNNLSAWAWTTNTIKLQSDGSPWRPIVHILDIAQAIHHALQAPLESLHGQIVNVGSTEQNYQVRDIADLICTNYPEARVMVADPSPDNRSYRVNFDKIQSFFPGYQCQWDAETGARHLAELFKLIQLTFEQFDGYQYHRMKQLVHLRTTGELDSAFYWTQPELLLQGISSQGLLPKGGASCV